jgi:hypothetical protein
MSVCEAWRQCGAQHGRGRAGRGVAATTAQLSNAGFELGGLSGIPCNPAASMPMHRRRELLAALHKCLNIGLLTIWQLRQSGRDTIARQPKKIDY